MTRSAKGAKISAAKKGVPLIARDPDELTLNQAANETGLSRKVLRAGALAQRLRHRQKSHANGGVVIIFTRSELLEDLGACSCSFPGCPAPAPGDSGRCGEHVARVKYETVELVCQHCGRHFTRPGSWLREREGRGTYCSNKCKGTAAYETRRADFRDPWTGDESREYHKGIERTIAADRLLDRRAARRSAANRYRYSSPHMCAFGPGVVREINGSRRWVCDPAELAEWCPPWAEDLARRVNIAYGRTNDPGVKGRLGGRAREWSSDQEAEVRRLDAQGKTQAQVQYLTGLTRAQVRYILDR